MRHFPPSWSAAALLVCAALAAASAVAAEPLDFKVGMSTPADPVRNGVYVWIQAFAGVFEHEGGRVRIYANSSLGGEKERMDQLAIGRLEVNETGGDELARLSTLFHASLEPFLIDSYEHWDALLEQTGFLADVNRELADDDLLLLDYAYTGEMAGLFTRGTPVHRIEDLRPLRLRILSASDLNLLAAWGVRGVRVAWEEVAQALQTGMVDGYLNPPIVAVMFGHGNVLDYFTDLRIGPAARLMVVSRHWYEALDAHDRALFDRAVQAGRAANRAWRRTAGARERAAVEKTGIEWIELTPAAREAWRALNSRIAPTRWDTPAAIAHFQELVEKAREEHP
ncbi:MAG: TRAP transporter substrate-binding protein [Steroidobacteraceae bacterium]